MKKVTSKVSSQRLLETQLRLNEMLPKHMQCQTYIQEMKDRLAAMRTGPRLVHDSKSSKQ